MLTIEIWSDIQCPWSYVVSLRLRRALRVSRRPIRVLWRYWSLELVNRCATPRWLLEAERAILARCEPDAFAPWQRDDFPSTFLPAMALAAAARQQDLDFADTVDRAAREAFFLDQCNVAVLPELIDTLDRKGIVTDRLQDAFWSGKGWRELWNDWQESHSRAIQGSPHLFVVELGTNVHNPGLREGTTPHGLPLVLHDDPAFIEERLDQLWRLDGDSLGGY